MLDWLDGYWTAMRHIARFESAQAPSDSYLQWAAAIGSIGAAVAAMIAAFLSWQAAKQNQLTSQLAQEERLIAERVEVTRMVRNAITLAQRKYVEYNNERAIQFDNLPIASSEEDIEEMDKIKNLIKEVPRNYLLIANRTELLKDVSAAKSFKDLQELKVDAMAIETEVFSVESQHKLHKSYLEALAVKIRYKSDD